MSRNFLYWVCQICGWSFHALINIFVLFSLEIEINKNFIFLTITSAFFFLLFSHLYRIYIKRKNWIKLYFSKLVPRVLLATIILSVAKLTFEYTVAYLFNISGPDDHLKLVTFFASLTSSMTIYFCWSLIYFLFHYVEEYNKSLKWEAYANEFELNRLKSQLNPHFIFNALNSIRALVDENPGKSKQAINQLSNILRSSLMMDKQKLIPFDDELKAVKDYLALETIRFEERLHSELEIHPSSSTFRVPPLMVQTLVENCIKHGISKLKEGGFVKVNTSLDELDRLRITIRNTGVYENGRASEGFGLDNTRQRLKLLFGNAASFKISNESQGTVLTEIIIPKS
jgi:two-component system, LytTR family, sensor kinase